MVLSAWLLQMMVTQILRMVIMNQGPWKGPNRGEKEVDVVFRKSAVPTVCVPVIAGTVCRRYSCLCCPASHFVRLLRNLQIWIYIVSIYTNHKYEVRIQQMHQLQVASVALPIQPLLLHASVKTVHLEIILVWTSDMEVWMCSVTTNEKLPSKGICHQMFGDTSL